MHEPQWSGARRMTHFDRYEVVMKRPFCVAAEGRLGERKIKRAGHAFPSSNRPPRAFFFRLAAAIFIGITSGSLYGRERLEKYKPSADGGTYWFKNKFDICDTGEALYQLS